MARDLSDTCAEEQATTQESPPKDGLWEQVRTLEEESGRLQAEVLSRDETIKLLEEQIKEMEGSHKAEKGELKKEITDLRSKIRLRKERIKELEKETRKKDERIDSQESIIKKLEAGAACRTMRLSNFAKDSCRTGTKEKKKRICCGQRITETQKKSLYYSAFLKKSTAEAK